MEAKNLPLINSLQKTNRELHEGLERYPFFKRSVKKDKAKSPTERLGFNILLKKKYNERGNAQNLFIEIYFDFYFSK